MVGDIFWFILWVLVWLTTVIGWIVIIGIAAASILDKNWGNLTGTILGALGWILLTLAVIAVATGEWNFGGRFLEDGCYRVGHYFNGKTTSNTYEPVNTCSND